MTVYSVALINIQQHVAIGLPELTRLVVVYGAGMLIDCMDLGTALDEPSSCLVLIDRLFQRSMSTRCSRADPV